MLKKIKKIINENRNYHRFNELQLKELEWANVYHDSIRGKVWLENLSLNIGRWAGNYSFFYVLNRILSDCKPQSILEFGLGESSKFISAYISNDLRNTKHLVIEQNELWYSSFIENNPLNINSKVQVCPLIIEEINSYKVKCYSNIESKVTKKYDLYIVDGPFGSPHFSRYDIVKIARRFEITDEFIIVIDDYNRIGEKETVNELITLFKEKRISIFKNSYEGNKCVCILATKKYKYLESL
jgi:hypothetical protein